MRVAQVLLLLLLRVDGLVGAPAQLENHDVLMELSHGSTPPPPEGVQAPYFTDHNWSDEGHHPEGQTYGQQEEEPKGSLEMNPPKVSDVSVHRVTVSWEAPGLPVSGYRVQIMMGGEVEATKDAPSESELALVVDDLRGNTKYSFKVAPLVGSSVGTFSDASPEVTTKTGVASAPTRLATSKLSLRSVVLTWSAPTDDGGAPIVGYRVSMREDATTEGGAEYYERLPNTRSTDTSVVIDKLKPDGHVYEFRVEAINSVGIGRTSQASDPVRTLYATVCGQVQNYQAVAMSDSVIRLTWDLPADVGASPTGYKFSYQPHARGPYKSAPDFDGNLTKREHDMVDLEAGTEYRFRIVAVNRIGDGSLKTSEVVSTQPGVPGQVTKPSIGFVTDTTCKLQWDAPKEHGAKITGYQILMQTGGDGGFTEKVEHTGSTDTQIKITGLEHGGVEYQFKVSAINSVGIGKPSPESDAMITKYSKKIATARAVQDAHDDFKAHEKIHELWKLKMENERYNKDLVTQKRISTNAAEVSKKSRKLAMQTRLRLDIEKRMCTKKLDMEKQFGQKQVNLQVTKFGKIADLEKLKWKKRMKVTNEKWEDELAKAKGRAMKTMEAESGKIQKKCDDDLTKQKAEITAKTAEDTEKAAETIAKLKKQVVQAGKELKDAVKQTTKRWQGKVDDLMEVSKKKMKKMEKKIIHMEGQIRELKGPTRTPENDPREARVEMGKLNEMREQLKKVVESTKEEREAHVDKLGQLQQHNEADITALTEQVTAKRQQENDLATQLDEADKAAKKAEEQLEEAGARRPQMFVDLGESLRSFDEQGRKDLQHKLAEAQRRVGLITKQREAVQAQRKAMEAQLARKKATKTAMESEMRVAMKKLDSATSGKEFQQSEALIKLVKTQVSDLQQKQARALNKTAEMLKADITPITPTAQTFDDRPCGNKSVVEENIIESMPGTRSDFAIYLKRSRTSAIERMNGNETEQKKVLQTCEMQKNCLALGGVKGNCNAQTMCSAGNPSQGTRPCKTCMSLFKLKRWRQLHLSKLKSCKGKSDCYSTPQVWRMCQSTDNATTCPEQDLGVAPFSLDDTSGGESHCTSCMEGDSLEVVHPETNTGFCRPSGHRDGRPMFSAPTCHALNDLVPTPGSTSGVCTQIQRSAALVKGTAAEGWLQGYNQWAYVTCNSRKVVHCQPPSDRDTLSALQRPASQGAEQRQDELAHCKTQAEVSCQTACRVNLDGSICQKDDLEGCQSSKSWNYTDSESVKRRLPMPPTLEGLDCDPARCTAQLCQTVAWNL